MARRPSARSSLCAFKPARTTSKPEAAKPLVPYKISITTEDGGRTLPMDITSLKHAILIARREVRREKGRQDHSPHSEITVQVFAGNKKVFEEVKD